MPDIPIAKEMYQKPVEELKAYENNPVVHPPQQKEKLKKEIQELGFWLPVLAKEEDGEIADGHLRLEIAEEIGLEKVPVIPVDELSEEQITALRIAMQKTAYDGQFDYERLSTEFNQLQEANFALESSTGFGHKELENMELFEDNFERGGEQLIEEFEEEGSTTEDEDSEGEGAEAAESVTGDANYLYVEYYQEPERFQKLKEKLDELGLLHGGQRKHDLDPDAFEEFIFANG